VWEGEAYRRQGGLRATACVGGNMGLAAERGGVHLFQIMRLVCHISQHTQEALFVVCGRVCDWVPRSIRDLHQLDTTEKP